MHRKSIRAKFLDDFGKGAASEKAHDDALQCQPGDNKWWRGWQFVS